MIHHSSNIPGRNPQYQTEKRGITNVPNEYKGLIIRCTQCIVLEGYIQTYG